MKENSLFSALIGSKSHWDKEKEKRQEAFLHGQSYRIRPGGLLGLFNSIISYNVAKRSVGGGAGSEKKR